jgi:DNA-directed RNA polymerase specialized sigma24 family protein
VGVTEKKPMTAHCQWTAEEFKDWLDANLSTSAARKRWILHAARILKGLPVEPDALLSETIARALFGARKFNRDFPIEANLHEAMRSVAHSWRKTRKRKPEISLNDLISSDEGDQDPLEVLGVPEGVQTSPEEDLAYKQEMDAMSALFEDREDAQMVFLGRAEGLRGAALAEFACVSQAELASVLRLITRRLAAYRSEK